MVVERIQADRHWLQAAADLGVVSASGNEQETNLAAAASAAESDRDWSVEILARGSYAGNADKVLAICKEDIGDGAFEVLGLDSSTPLGKLVFAAKVAVTRPASASASGTNSRTRFRASAGRKLVAEVVTASESLRTRPPHDADASVADRLVRVGQIWGHAWLTRQAVALLPGGLDLEAVARDAAR